MPKKRLVIFLLSFTIFLCIFTSCICCGFTSVLTTNKEIPIFTNVVESFEQNFIDPEAMMQKNQRTIADEVIAMLEESTNSDGMSYDRLVEKMQSFTEDHQIGEKAGKISYEITGGISEEDSENPLVSFAMNGEGRQDNQNNRSESTMHITAEAFAISADSAFEIITDEHDNNTTYFIKINTLPLFQFINSSIDYDLENNWLSLSTADFEEYLEEEGYEEEERKNEENRIKLTTEELAAIEEILKSPEIFGTITWQDGKTFNGKRARCFRIRWTQKEIERLLEMVDDAGFIESNYIYNRLHDSIQSVDTMYIDYCFDRKTHDLYEISVNTDFTFEDEPISFNTVQSDTNEKITYTINLQAHFLFSDYGTDQEVSIPEDSINMLDMFDDLYPEPVYEEYDDWYYEDDEYEYDFEDEFDYETEIESFYILYLDSTDADSEELMEYIEKNNLMLEADITVFYIDQSSYAQESFESTCSANDIACEVPLLEYFPSLDYDGSLEFPEIEYFTGTDEIIKHFEETLE